MSSNTSPITACDSVFLEGGEVEGVGSGGVGVVTCEAEGFRESYDVPIHFTRV